MSSSKRSAYEYRYGATDGSVAYDLGNPALYPEYVYGQPLDIPAAPEVEDEVVAAGEIASTQALSPIAVIGYAIAAVLLVFSLLSRVQLTQLSDQCVALETSLAALQEQEAKLLISYESSLNLPEIESYAINTLGMQKPRSDQIRYISGDVQDRAVVLTGTGEQTNFVNRVGDFISSFLEYFS